MGGRYGESEREVCFPIFKKCIFSISLPVLRKNVQPFRVGLTFKAYRLLYHSILGSRVKTKKQKYVFPSVNAHTLLDNSSLGLRAIKKRRGRGMSPLPAPPFAGPCSLKPALLMKVIRHRYDHEGPARLPRLDIYGIQPRDNPEENSFLKVKSHSNATSRRQHLWEMT